MTVEVNIVLLILMIICSSIVAVVVAFLLLGGMITIVDRFKMRKFIQAKRNREDKDR